MHSSTNYILDPPETSDDRYHLNGAKNEVMEMAINGMVKKKNN